MKEELNESIERREPTAEDWEDWNEELYGLTPRRWAEFIYGTMQNRPDDPQWIGMPRSREGLLKLAEASAGREEQGAAAAGETGESD